MSNAFITKIRDYAEKLELGIEEKSDDFVAIDFDMGEGRSQRVVVLYHESENNEHKLVEISSAVLDLEGLPDQQVGLEMATKLLVENDSTIGAKWAIDKGENSAHLIATARWWLDEMDIEEFEMSIYNTAKMADDLESTLGIDNF